MPEPTSVWGFHVVSGAVTAALVGRTATGGFEILEALAERCSADPAEAMRQAQTLLRRRGIARRGAIVALPDATGCLLTATIPPEELDLSEHEITNELYEWTPFEPEAAELRHVCVLREGRRQERLIAAMPRDPYRRFVEILQPADLSRLGVGVAGGATWRGARALGLVPPDGLLVEVLPRVTLVYVAAGPRMKRYALALGETDIERDATAVDVLAGDLTQLAGYSRALRRRDDQPAAEARFALVGMGATSPGVRQRLASVLGPRLAEGPVGDVLVAVAPRAPLPAVPLAALAGAVGAALEALRPAEDRLVLRHLPADLPPYRDRRPVRWVAALALVLVAAAGAYTLWAQRDAASASRSAPPAPNVVGVKPERPAAAPATQEAPAPLAPRDTSHAPDAPHPPAEVVTVQPLPGGRARVRWQDGAAGRTIRRAFLGESGAGAETAVPVYTVDSVAGEWVDEVPGPSGTYAWSIGDGPAVRSSIDVPVAIDLLGPGNGDGARFQLRRSWHGAELTVVVDVPTGGRVEGTSPSSDARAVPISLASGLRLDTVRTRVESERAAVRVPRFAADGRVERGADGSAVTDERVIAREKRIFEADVVGPDGSRRTWSRKMTDG